MTERSCLVPSAPRYSPRDVCQRRVRCLSQRRGAARRAAASFRGAPGRVREIAAQLPEALSRRTILRKIAGDIRHAPEKGDIAGRRAKARRPIRQVGRSFERLVTGRAVRPAP